MFLTDEEREFLRKREEERLVAASQPDPASVSVVEPCNGEKSVRNGLALIVVDKTSDDGEPSKKLLQQTNGNSGYHAVPQPVETVNEEVVFKYETPTGYVLPECFHDENFDWTPFFMYYPNCQKLIKMAKRCVVKS